MSLKAEKNGDDNSQTDLDSSSSDSCTFNIDNDRAAGLQLTFAGGLAGSPKETIVGGFGAYKVRPPLFFSAEGDSARIVEKTEATCHEDEVRKNSDDEEAIQEISNDENPFANRIPKVPLLSFKRDSSMSELMTKEFSTAPSGNRRKANRKPRSKERHRSSRNAQESNSKDDTLRRSSPKFRKEISNLPARSIPADTVKSRPPRLNSRNSESSNRFPPLNVACIPQEQLSKPERSSSRNTRNTTRRASSDSPDMLSGQPRSGRGRLTAKKERRSSRTPTSRSKPSRSKSSAVATEERLRSTDRRSSSTSIPSTNVLFKDTSTRSDRRSLRSSRRLPTRRSSSTATPTERRTTDSAKLRSFVVPSTPREIEGNKNSSLVSRLTRTLSESRRRSDTSQFMNTGFVTPRQRRQSYTKTPLSRKKSANSVAMVKHFQLALAIGIDGSDSSVLQRTPGRKV